MARLSFQRASTDRIGQGDSEALADLRKALDSRLRKRDSVATPLPAVFDLYFTGDEDFGNSCSRGNSLGSGKRLADHSPVLISIAESGGIDYQNQRSA